MFELYRLIITYSVGCVLLLITNTPVMSYRCSTDNEFYALFDIEVTFPPCINFIRVVSTLSIEFVLITSSILFFVLILMFQPCFNYVRIVSTYNHL